jgi:hypothetical protein
MFWGRATEFTKKKPEGNKIIKLLFLLIYLQGMESIRTEMSGHMSEIILQTSQLKADLKSKLPNKVCSLDININFKNLNKLLGTY